MKGIKEILTFHRFDIDLDEILVDIIFATAFVWLVYTIQCASAIG